MRSSPASGVNCHIWLTALAVGGRTSNYITLQCWKLPLSASPPGDFAHGDSNRRFGEAPGTRIDAGVRPQSERRPCDRLGRHYYVSDSVSRGRLTAG